jgi:hypothetical protein
VVTSAPADLPEWLRGLRGEAPREQVLAGASRHGVSPELAADLLERLERAGVVGSRRPARVAIASRTLVAQPLREALIAAGVEVVRNADVVVFPQGQVPSLVAAPPARRLLPVWFAARAVHVGPVLDDTCGPCPRCVDLTWTDAEPLWPRLVAQAGSVPGWSDPAQLVHAAALISQLAGAGAAVGLEMIADPAHPGPRWRVWAPHPRCACRT